MDADPSIGFEVFVILALIFANGVFAMTEIAIVSSRKARLERQAAEGSAGAKQALELANDPTELLSTVQVGITLIGIVTGAFGGATIAHVLAVYIQPLPFIGAYSSAVAFAVVIGGITYLSLIFGELVPKKIALNHPEAIASAVAIPMRFFSKMFLPVVWLLGASTDFVFRLLRIKKPTEQGVTEEEIKIMIAEGTAVGTFEEAERAIVERVFRLGDMRVSALMTPRTQIDWIDIEDDEENVWRSITESTHSKLPVGNGNIDDLLGVVYLRDILANRDQLKLPIRENIESPLFVPASLRAFKLLEQFQQSGTHVAIVLDEFGGTIGLVTLHDILEQLVGQLPEEEDNPEIVKRADNSWLMDGLLSIEEFKRMFSLAELPAQSKDYYQTLGGFVTSYLGNVPKTGETFEWAGLRFEVVDMDRTRVDKVIVTQLNLEYAE